ncbi:response regulator [Pelagicoccus enzymogenes]|uniref:response regulator n=1 Tax=Pelagicoccus enzymogenes TaxID=2773457 RepID=UPI002811085D|nr:response regulator [Pelagicoccus enzymogenes]
MPQSSTSLVGSETAATNAASPQVLLVDDTESNTLVAKAILKRCGSVVPDTAENGLEALEKLRKRRYHLIFMDCMMPEMDGYEATRAIRDGEAGTEHMDVPIVALTANAMQGDREICLASGMSDYLTKPIDPRLLVESLNAWLGRKHGG